MCIAEDTFGLVQVFLGNDRMITAADWINRSEPRYSIAEPTDLSDVPTVLPPPPVLSFARYVGDDGDGGEGMQ